MLSWLRLAAVAPIRPLAWEPLYVAGAALKKKEREREIQKHPRGLQGRLTCREGESETRRKAETRREKARARGMGRAAGRALCPPEGLILTHASSDTA